MADEKVQVVYCPVCGQPRRILTRKLYGILTCRQCVDRFASRRFRAAFVDWAIYQAFAFPLFLAFSTLLASVTTFEQFDNLLLPLAFLINIPAHLVLALKDGFQGYSPGKWLLGLRTYSRATGEPATFTDSLARNWAPALIPFVAFLVLISVRRGKRLGDGLRDTKVVWTKHANSPVFEVRPLPVLAEAPPELTPAPVRLTEDTNPYRAPPA
ncbi:MAG: RDD family protein [Pirellulales bacterium]|nr:RDD family protein [Pirellulales bacterium]